MKMGKTIEELAVELDRQNKSKRDFVAKLDAVGLVVVDGKPRMTIGARGSEEDKGRYGITAIAHGQMAEHVRVPKPYYDRMLTEAPDLLATNVEHWFAKYPAPRMLRTLDGDVRAMLSPSFQRFDNYDFVAAAFPILAERRLTIMSMEVTPTRLYIKAVDEQLFRDVPIGHKMGDGSHRIFETFAPAIILSNSEVGFGRLVVESGVYTRACTNLALFASSGMKRTHVGARHKLAEAMSIEDLDAVLSDATKAKMAAALWAQVRDVIAAAFDAATIKGRVEKMEEAAGRRIGADPQAVVELVAERFGMVEDERAAVFRHLIEGGKLSQYGLSAAITRAAQDVESYDRATELEYAGGAVVTLGAAEWHRMAEAA